MKSKIVKIQEKIWENCRRIITLRPVTQKRITEITCTNENVKAKSREEIIKILSQLPTPKTMGFTNEKQN